MTTQSSIRNYEVTQDGGVPIKSWTKDVAFEDKAREQLINISKMPFIHKWVAVMPDVHLGIGATIGSVVPTIGAVIPAAVGVDIGCGMMAVKTNMTSHHLPEDLGAIRDAIERAVPHGRSARARGGRDKGAWSNIPDDVAQAWAPLAAKFDILKDKHRVLKNTNNIGHLGTLGTGNHFIEICLDEHDSVWFMLHSGSRGVGNRIGTHFIEQAKKDMERWMIQLPHKDLAYLPEGSDNFVDYVEAVEWAQTYARINREVMMERVIAAVEGSLGCDFEAKAEAVNCHHNYVSRENHYVCSCSHGAGRVMSRTAAKKAVSLEEHKEAVKGIECRVDEGVIDETPSAYKDIDKVMEAQNDLVEVVYTLKQIVCVKG